MRDAARRSDARPPAIEAVIDETRALFHRLKAAAEELHAQGAPSAGRRGVLLSLAAAGPASVPRLARARPVSRQHVQALVDSLAEDGLVELLENPEHRRSRLVALTPRGAALARSMRRREERLFRALDLGVSESELLAAAGVLRALRVRLERADLRSLARITRPAPAARRASRDRRTP